MEKTTAQLYLERHKQLSEKEKEILLLAIKWEVTPIIMEKPNNMPTTPIKAIERFKKHLECGEVPFQGFKDKEHGEA